MSVVVRNADGTTHVTDGAGILDRAAAAVVTAPIMGANVAGANAVTAIGSGVIDAGKGVAAGAEAIGGFAAKLGERATWIRVVYVVAGLGALIGGALILNRGVVAQAVGVAADVIPAGKVAKVASAAAKK